MSREPEVREGGRPDIPIEGRKSETAGQGGETTIFQDIKDRIINAKDRVLIATGFK